MGIFDKQINALKNLDPKKTIKGLEGDYVPVSNSEKVKILDTKNEAITFERELSDDELSYFRDWLKVQMQKGIRKQLGL